MAERFRRIPVWFRSWRQNHPFVAALSAAALIPLAAIFGTAVAQNWTNSLSAWAKWLLIVASAVVGALVVYVSVRGTVRGTLYSIVALTPAMVTRYRDQLRLAQERSLDFRPVWRVLPIPPRERFVDVTAEADELRRAVEVARQSDDEATGRVLALNTLWPIGLYLGFTSSFPDDTRLLELTKKGHATGDKRLPPIQFVIDEIGTDEGDAPTHVYKARCGCRFSLGRREIHIDRTPRVPLHICDTSMPRLVAVELTGSFTTWPPPDGVANGACCGVRLALFQAKPCVDRKHWVDRDKSIIVEFRADERGRPDARNEFEWSEPKPGSPDYVSGWKLSLPASDAAGISRWLADAVFGEVCAKSYAAVPVRRVVLRARMNKSADFAIGHYLSKRCEVARRSAWPYLALVNEHGGHAGILRVHPAQSNRIWG